MTLKDYLLKYLLILSLVPIFTPTCERKQEKSEPETEFVEVNQFETIGFIDSLRRKASKIEFEDLDNDGDLDIIALDSSGKMLKVYDNKIPLKFDIHRDKNLSKLIMKLRADGYDIEPHLQDSRFKYYDDIAKLLGREKERKRLSRIEIERLHRKWLKEYISENFIRAQNFIFQNEPILNQIWFDYNIEPWTIASFFSRETKCGLWLGNRDIFSSLISVFKDFPEYRYGRHFNVYIQLKSLCKQAKMDNKDIFDYKGSFMGAYGLGQFLPSNIHRFGVDYDDDGQINLTQVSDAAASTANYLKHFGWERNKVAATSAYNRGEYYRICILEMEKLLKEGYFRKKEEFNKFILKNFNNFSAVSDKTKHKEKNLSYEPIISSLEKDYDFEQDNLWKGKEKEIPYLGKKEKRFLF